MDHSGSSTAEYVERVRATLTFEAQHQEDEPYRVHVMQPKDLLWCARGCRIGATRFERGRELSGFGTAE